VLPLREEVVCQQRTMSEKRGYLLLSIMVVSGLLLLLTQREASNQFVTADGSLTPVRRSHALRKPFWMSISDAAG
jgi:hypothetical protein